MALDWNEEDDDDLTVLETKPAQTRPHLDDYAPDETVPYTRSAQYLLKELEAESPYKPLHSLMPFSSHRIPLQAALPRDRFAACLLDTILILYLNLMAGRILWLAIFHKPWFSAFQHFELPIRIIAFLALALIYYVVFEATIGATPGKLLCRLRVVDLEGLTPPLANIFLRNLCRLFDYPLAFIVALLSMESSHFFQTLGDRAAHTIVIKKSRQRLKAIDLRNVAVSSTFIRLLSFLADVSIFILFLWLYARIMPYGHPGLFRILFWLFPFLFCFYFAIFEFAISTTPGKFLFSRQVVLDNGEPLDATAAILRNLFRPLDVFVAYPLLALTRKKQRLGDLVADTLVIKYPRQRRGFIALGSLAFIMLVLAYLGSQNPYRNRFQQQLNTLFHSVQIIHSPTPSLFQEPLPPSSNNTSPPSAPNPSGTDLQMNEFYFAAGADPTAIRADGVFRRGDLIFLFFKVSGFQKNESGGVSLSEGVEVIDPAGKRVYRSPDTTSFTQAVSPGTQSILFANQINLLPNSPLGNYRLMITLQDGLNGTRAVFEKTFSLQ